MKKTYWFVFSALLIFLSACQTSEKLEQSAPNSDKLMKVVIEQDGVFPEFLVGRWRNEQYNWEFVFEKDGRISSLVHNLGAFELKPGIETITPMVDGTSSVVESGQWTVIYTPGEKKLIIEIVLKSFYVPMGEVVMAGYSTDLMVGEVFPNADYWQADWFSESEYIFDMTNDIVIMEDPNDLLIDCLTFKRVVE